LHTSSLESATTRASDLFSSRIWPDHNDPATSFVMVFGPQRRRDSQLTHSGPMHSLNWAESRSASRAVIPAASAEEARQLLRSMVADSIGTRYGFLSTFFFLFFQSVSDYLLQFRVAELRSVGPFEVFGLQRRYFA
jgi:hypothetical protein